MPKIGPTGEQDIDPELNSPRFLNILYSELRKLAAAKLSREATAQTLQPTALVHEAWLRIAASEKAVFKNEAHFFAAAAEAMRRILIDRARRKKSERHGGKLERADLDDLEIPCPFPEEQLLDVNDALDKLALVHPVPAQLIKLRYFAGLSVKEAASFLGISLDKAKDYNAFARAWLYREMTKEKTPRTGSA